MGRRKNPWIELIKLLLDPGSVEREIVNMGRSYSHIIRTAIGPDGLARMAQEEYVKGRIEVDEFERRLDRIAKEML